MSSFVFVVFVVLGVEEGEEECMEGKRVGVSGRTEGEEERMEGRTVGVSGRTEGSRGESD